MGDDIPATIAALFASRWHQGYTKSKLRTDPLYDGVYQAFADSDLPLLDLGCGLGIAAFYLRERGLEFPILGIDYDTKKIEAASLAAEAYKDLEFRHGDAREGIPDFTGNVSILDILQFFTAEQQNTLLENAARSVGPGGKLVIRTGLKDKSLRFKITVLGDLLAKATFWMKAAPTHYPTEATLRETLEPLGFEIDVTPLWGSTPFNNHLVVGRRTLPS